MTKVFHRFFKNLNSGYFSTRLAARDMETKSGTTSSSKANQTIFLYIYFLFPWKWKDTGKNDKNDIQFFPISNGLAIQTLGWGATERNKKEWLRIWCHISAENWHGLQKTATEQFPQSLKEGFSNWIVALQKCVAGYMHFHSAGIGLGQVYWACLTAFVIQKGLLPWHKVTEERPSPGNKFW